MDYTKLLEFALNQSVPVIILVSIGWFVVKKLWPWLTEIYIPERHAMDISLIENLLTMAKHLENAGLALEHFAEHCLNIEVDSRQSGGD